MRAGGRRPAAGSCASCSWLWDPIGVNDSFPWTYDEYDSHAGPLLTRLMNGADAANVAEYLRDIAHWNMGLSHPSGMASLNDTARQIVDWYPSSIEWWRERSLK
jgi:hypothetical protein